MQSRREFLKTIAVTAAGMSAFPNVSKADISNDQKAARPNIIFILADDLGYGDLGCYGQKVIKTPNIDDLAQVGMRFTQHYAGSTVCAPSRCVLMTGLHTGHCTVRGNKPILLKDSDVTVADVLKKGGYRTGIIGKWGLVQQNKPGGPRDHGFDHFFGYLNNRHAHNYYPEYLWRNGEKVYLNGNELEDPNGTEEGWSVRREQYSHDLFTEEALKFITDNGGKKQPFFLYLCYTIPHANNEGGRRTGDGMEVPGYGIYKNEDWPDPQKGYAAMITRMDGDVGKIIDKLKDLGLDENTIVIFSSDNGPHSEGGTSPEFFNSNGRLRGIKRDMYEGGVRVPFIAYWPGKIKQGTLSNHVSGFQDFMPTACELAAVPAPENIDGISMTPTLLGNTDKQKKHHHLYWEFHERGGKQAVRWGDWKAVRLNWHKNPDTPLELYHLAADPEEKNNIAQKHPEIVEYMERLLENSRTNVEPWKVPM